MPRTSRDWYLLYTLQYHVYAWYRNDDSIMKRCQLPTVNILLFGTDGRGQFTVSPSSIKCLHCFGYLTILLNNATNNCCHIIDLCRVQHRRIRRFCSQFGFSVSLRVRPPNGPFCNWSGYRKPCPWLWLYYLQGRS